MLLASWNVNSLRARQEGVLTWLDETQPDVLALQETRVADTAFPAQALRERGYDWVHCGLGGYAGVALLARQPLQEPAVGEEHRLWKAQGRLVRATVGDLRVINVYVPTRKAIGKVDWLESLSENLLGHEDLDRPLVLCGDFNICFDERDVWDVRQLAEWPLFPDRAEDRAFRRLLGDCGLFDLFRELHPGAREYTWFDYKRSSFARRRGFRLDYVFGNRAVLDRTTEAWIDYPARAMAKPSDHAPVCIRLS